MADIRENWEEEEEQQRTAFEGFMKEMMFAMPCIVQEDSDGKTAKLQPVIKGVVQKPDGKREYVDLPTIDKAPIHWVSGGADKEGKGGFTMTHPITKGDEGMFIISSRPMDNWYEKGGTQKPIDARMHHLSDGKFIPGMFSKPRQLKNISTKTVQLRSNDEGDDKKPKHLVDIDHVGGKITTSVDSGKHVTTVDKGSGISHVSSIKVHVQAPKAHIEAPEITTKGTWNHDGGLKATETIQAGVGFKGPVIESSPGSVPGVKTVSS